MVVIIEVISMGIDISKICLYIIIEDVKFEFIEIICDLCVKYDDEDSDRFEVGFELVNNFKCFKEYMENVFVFVFILVV